MNIRELPVVSSSREVEESPEGELAATNPKILIHSRESDLYLKTLEQWTDHVEEAHNFTSTVSALFYVAGAKLLHCEILLRYGDPQFDLRLAVGK